MGSKNAPPAPDYVGGAKQTAASNQAATNTQTQANRPDQSNPFGFSNWTQGPNGQWSQQSGFGGALGQGVNNAMGAYGAQLGQPMQNGQQARDQAIKATYDASTARLDPRFRQEGDALNTQLANQGLDPNSAAARGAQSQFGMEKNDAYGQAMNNAIMGGTAAGQSVFNENMASRMAPLSELQGLHGLLQQQGFQGAGNAGGANILQALQAQGQYGLQAQQNENSAWGDLFGGIMGAGGAAAGAYAKSDERVKQDVQRLPVEAAPGVPLAAFSYRETPHQRHVGVIAQDLERHHPEHVVDGPDGIKRVSPQFAPFRFK